MVKETELMEMHQLTCFKAYDVRGELGVDFDATIAYRIGRAVAQHFRAKTVVVGQDARETSPELAVAVSHGITDAGSDVLYLGLSGTEEMYWAVTEFGSCAGIEVTASHNPINYNGIKIVKSGSQPLHTTEDFQRIKALAESENWVLGRDRGNVKNISIPGRKNYVKKCLSFVEIPALRSLRIVVNSGNGAAGPTIDAISGALLKKRAPLELIRVNHEPDHTFPNGIPNPLLPENHAATGNKVINECADFGVAFDGDFDRCFFFDSDGNFVPGEYIVGLIASNFLIKEPGEKIVHDPRIIWNIQDIADKYGGITVQSKTGHAFIKKTMRSHKAIYGGEMSAHHYFRDFAYCDSGMIPWLIVAEIISKTGKSLKSLVEYRQKKFPSSGEINFKVSDADAAIESVMLAYKSDAELDNMDGISLAFSDWRFNLRKSNTEPLVRLNVESRRTVKDLAKKVELLKNKIGATFE